MRTKNMYLIGLGWLAAFFSCAFAVWSASVEFPKAESTPLEVVVEDASATLGGWDPIRSEDPLGTYLFLTGSTEANVVEVPKSGSTESGIVDTACELIYQGKFDVANQVIVERSRLGRLAKIIEEYTDINQRRQSAREAAYKEQIAELEKFQAGTDRDTNDVNDVLKVLGFIAKAREFADEAQREQLFSESFVKQVFERAKSKADEFESKGKWLDAYTSCYSWLQAIEPNNEVYSDHADELLDKATIVASFQDSPCESRSERYAGVKKEMFVRAIDSLKRYYVSIIDYRQMTTKAITRCRLLGEVVALSFSDIESSLSAVPPDVPSEEPFLPPGSDELSAWSAGLAAILDEVKQSPTGVDRDKFIDVFEKVLALNTVTAQLPRRVLIAQFAEAALSALDRYTVIVWPRQVSDFEKLMTNQFTGIGIEITKRKGLLTVASLLPDTPAYNSGLDAGDVIEVVDGIETKDMSLGCAIRTITGPAGTKVTLTIRRSGEEKTRDIIITRARIIVPTIRGWQRTPAGKWLYMIDEEDKIGYVRVTSFSGETAPALEQVLTELEAEGLKGLILDLRFNTGGLLESAVAVTDKFIEEGLIVSTRPRGLWTYISAHKRQAHLGYPLVVLINSYSASASEIVAGALADERHKRAILVGERTHGKGSVQGITDHPGGGAKLKYTMAYYHLPSGQRVESQDTMKKEGRQDWGVGPDVEVKLRNDEIRRMSEVQRDNDVLFQANHSKSGAALKKYMVEETLAADPQLAVGVLVIRSKLIQAGSGVSGANKSKGFSLGSVWN
ncbi:MAG TPA: S41 family peptidase [Sedimentisphaerales bacterium]|nr:S41 family peptidase [Sedimentisphaerales bacterium]